LKALVHYDDVAVLISVEDDSGNFDVDKVFDIVNKDKYPDYCTPADYISERATIIAYFTDDSEMFTKTYID
jgi:hypothetical protein